MRSLRQRAILGGAVWALGCVMICGAILYFVLERIAVTRFQDALLDRHLQVVAALERNAGNPLGIKEILTDPGFRRVYSGRYWQIAGEDVLVTSDSLFDTSLAIPSSEVQKPFFEDEIGPDGPIRVVNQRIALQDGSSWWVSTAESLAALEDERSQLLGSLLISFGLVAAFGVLGATLQISTVLKPLGRLRDDVMHRWDRGEAIDPAQYPDEVAPLIVDINTVIHRNREIIAGARRQAADLAHALKTPSAILRNELETARGGYAAVGPLGSALDRIDAQLKRSLARMRAANGSANAAVPHGVHSDLKVVLPRLVRAFRALSAGTEKHVILGTFDPAFVRMDSQDLEEVLGNLLDNALKWCRRDVRIIASCRKASAKLCIEDDGPGIPDEHRRTALVAGGRLDMQTEGTGLGLAIASDLVRAYGGTLELGTSQDLGGLKVTLLLDALPYQTGDALRSGASATDPIG